MSPYNADVFAAGNVAISFAMAAFVGGIYLLWRKSDVQIEAREPPVALSKIPFLGHIIGMMKYQIGYFEMLCAKYRWPIFTMKVFSTRIYVIQAPELTQLVLRDAKRFTFDGFTVVFTQNALDIRQEAMDIVTHKSETGVSYLTDLHHEMYSALALGPGLLDSNARILNVLARSLNKITTKGQEVDLYSWLRDIYTLAAGETLYGPENPIDNLEIIEAIWAFEDSLFLLMTGVLPSVVARKAYLGRRSISKAFTKYYNSGLDKNANSFVQGRARSARKFGLTNEDLGAFEISICFASVTNAVPSVFWMLSYIFSDPSLVSSLREEIGGITDQGTIDITKLRTDCQLLVSTFQEMQRLVQAGNAVRFVTTDVLLNDQYLLKQGSIVQIPSSVLHQALETWGPDAKSFNARRFLNVPQSKDERKARQQGFIPFGGGKHLCPGRHLAFAEIMGFIAAFVMGFDIEGIKIIKFRTPKMGGGARKPDGDIKVSIKRRVETKDTQWTFKVGEMADLESNAGGN